jgi:hypothetical protein
MSLLPFWLVSGLYLEEELNLEEEASYRKKHDIYN